MTESAPVVLDASVMVASLVPAELHHDQALALVARVPNDQAFVVPSLFRLEVVAALARRGATAELLDAVDARLAGPRFQAVAVDPDLLERAAAIARRARLRAYDALYAAVAEATAAVLVTLDEELASRLRAACPEIAVDAGLPPAAPRT